MCRCCIPALRLHDSKSDDSVPAAFPVQRSARPALQEAGVFRYAQWEVGLTGAWQNSQSEEFENGESLEIDSGSGWGFNIGYNWNAHINFQYKFTTIKPKYTAVIVPEEGDPLNLDNKLTKNSNQVNVTWNILARKITPFVQAGIGWTKLDSNILSVPPVTGCWWGPWWGYVCSTTWIPIAERVCRTTWDSACGGISARHWFVKAQYNREWVTTDNKLDFDTVQADFGYRF